MAIDFGAYLSDDQKRSILEQRVQQFAAEAFQHEINKKLAESMNNEQGVAAADDALAQLETAINLHQEELSKLAAPAPAPAE